MRKLPLICICLFVLLCTLHLSSQRPLWLDEDFVYQNLLKSEYSELFSVLEPAQSFPRVYLITIQALAIHFNYHVLALRFLPFVFMIAAFFLWLRIYRMTTGELPFLVLLMLSWACSYHLIYYAAELKPYSMDVFVGGAFLMYFQYLKRFETNPMTVLPVVVSLLIPFLIFFSYTSLFFVWMVPYNLLLLSRRNKKMLSILLWNVIVCVLCFVLFYFSDIQYSITAAGVHYWDSYFLGTESFGAFFEPFGEGLKRYVVFWFGAGKFFRRGAVIFIPFFLYALVRFGCRRLKEDRFAIFHLESLAFILFIEAIIFGLLGKYPFTGGRITLFFAPFVFYLIIKGILSLRKFPILQKGFLGYYGLYCCAALIATTLYCIKLF